MLALCSASFNLISIQNMQFALVGWFVMPVTDTVLLSIDPFISLYTFAVCKKELIFFFSFDLFGSLSLSWTHRLAERNTSGVAQ